MVRRSLGWGLTIDAVLTFGGYRCRSARISILFTVIRLQYGRIRVIFGLIAVLFGLMWAILEAQLLWTCEGNTDWKYTELPQCHLGFPVALAQLISMYPTPELRSLRRD
jgi:hypothetical protein